MEQKRRDAIFNILVEGCKDNWKPTGPFKTVEDFANHMADNFDSVKGYFKRWGMEKALKMVAVVEECEKAMNNKASNE